MRSRTPAGSRVDSRRSLTSSRRRWLVSWCSSSACWRLQALEVGGVHQGLGRVPGEDRQRRLVVGIEPVAARLSRRPARRGRRPRTSSGRAASIPVRSSGPTAMPRGSADGVPEPDGLAVLGDPAGEALADPDAQGRRDRAFRDPRNVPLEGDRLAHPGRVVHAVDADRVVTRSADAPRPRSRGRSRSTSWRRLRRTARSEIERSRPASVRVDVGQPGVPDGGRHVVGEGPGEVHLAASPVVRSCGGRARGGRAAPRRRRSARSRPSGCRHASRSRGASGSVELRSPSRTWTRCSRIAVIPAVLASRGSVAMRSRGSPATGRAARPGVSGCGCVTYVHRPA